MVAQLAELIAGARVDRRITGIDIKSPVIYIEIKDLQRPSREMALFRRELHQR